MRLSLSWIYYRAHKYFKLAGRGYEYLFGTAGFALEKGRWYSVAKLTEWNHITNLIVYFYMATYLVMLTLCGALGVDHIPFTLPPQELQAAIYNGISLIYYY